MNLSQNYVYTPSANACTFPESRIWLPNHQIPQQSIDHHPSIQNPLNQQQLLLEYNSNYPIYQHNLLPQILNDYDHYQQNCFYRKAQSTTKIVLSSYDHNQQNYIDSGEQSTSEDVQRTDSVTSAITQGKLVSANLPICQIQQPIDHYLSTQLSVSQQPLSECNRNHNQIYQQKSSTQTPNYCNDNPKNNFYTREHSTHQSASKVQQTTDVVTPTTTQEKVKRNRATYGDIQLNYLEECFQTNQYLKSVDQKKEIALVLNLKEKQVKKWFQNRRMREKYNVEPQPSHNQNEQVNYVYDENEHFNLEGLNAQATAGSGLINQNENTYYGNNSSYWNQENDPNYRYEPSTFRNEQFVPATGQHNMYQGFNNLQENNDFRQYQNTDDNSYGNFAPNQDIYGQNTTFSRAFTPVQNFNQNQFYNYRPHPNESLNQNGATASPSVEYPTLVLVQENHISISNNYYNGR